MDEPWVECFFTIMCVYICIFVYIHTHVYVYPTRDIYIYTHLFIQFVCVCVCLAVCMDFLRVPTGKPQTLGFRDLRFGSKFRAKGLSNKSKSIPKKDKPSSQTHTWMIGRLSKST